ncbi:penicillin-binding protein 1C [Nibrella saemangeumensis]|uniref:penicillin-binding protein 1C n=1 Tax=Nibrella saemangeumensis TaxID=1084526 RepID=UPI0031E838E9
MISITKRLLRPLWIKLAGGLLLVFLLLDILFPFNTRIDYSPIITAADGTILHTFLNRQDKWRLYAELPEITPNLRKAIVYKEDRFFFYHPGINPLALFRAAGKNLFSGRRTSGASTITMQVVRLLEPRQRTYSSKLFEAFRALQLELHYSKDEILQLYLNLIPYGSNIEGLKSASLLYFGKQPKLLSLAEITTLTIIPNRPSSLRLGTRNAYVVQERNRWLRRFEQAGVFDSSVIADALEEPLTARRRKAPRQAPHLALRLSKENPGMPIVQATIRPAVQAAAEQLVQNYVNRMRALNIHNAAVLIINNQTMNVEAYVGSADFANALDGGQVDGVRAVRSPGSALKPMLYALAFDKGLITPKSKLNDVPTNFGGYEPGNYDQRFNGAVTAEFALANSLNIPAVKLLKEVGTPAFTGLLQKAAFTTIQKQSKDLGLSMILGGCGVTLEEMTRLFTVFANEGQLKSINLTASASQAAGTPLISPEAAFLVTNTLTQITRPDLPNNFDNSYHLPRIAWKTGTSYGRRDAWSIGYNRHYTVGIWVGNFSGEGVPELSGANTATPLLFQIFNTIDYNSPKGWFLPPKSIASRAICPESGAVPGEFCTSWAVDYYIMGVTRYQRCQHQKTVFTNPAGTLSYCAHCLPDSGSVQRLYPNLSPELIAYYQLKRIPYAAIPVHNPACERIFEPGADQHMAPFIASPNDRSEYFVDPKAPADMQLSCQASNEVRAVYWYLNDKLYRKARPTEAVFFKPRPGALKISCADDRGRHADIQILIKSL